MQWSSEAVRTSATAGPNWRCRSFFVLLIAALVLAACRSGSINNADSAPDSTPLMRPLESTTPSTAAPVRESDDTSESCDGIEPITPDGPRSTMVETQVDGYRVRIATYPRPDSPGNPWSHWGQAALTRDGRHISAVGDHLGPDGNSHFYVFDPERDELIRFADVHSIVAHESGSWGYGKVHAPLVSVGCDRLIAATYWGTRRNLEIGGSYDGDQLLSLDTSAMQWETLGTPIRGHGIPSLAGFDTLIFGEAVFPNQDSLANRGPFFVFDLESNEVVYRSDENTHSGFRSILVTSEGDALIAGEDNGLLRYRRGQELTLDPGVLPQGWLRAVTAPTAEGTVYGVTRAPERFFARSGDGEIRDLGPARGYTTSIALLPETEEILYAPGAHGDAPEFGAALYAIDPTTGAERTLVRLLEAIEHSTGLVAGGTYSVVTDSDHHRIYVMFNAGLEVDEPWGEVVLVVVDLADPEVG